jgi:DNA polymerase-3 subunit alpha
MRRLCRQMTITNVDEIIALIAFTAQVQWIGYPIILKGKEDPSTIKFPHPLLEEVCEETYGVMVYQEQVMEAARRVAGYSLGGADILRRAMGKKKPEEMAKQREIFVKGARKRIILPKRRPMKFLVFWKSLPGMDLINHTRQPME